jgi:putative NIF3 family GTP cyclohydrolase 1 type 2
MTIQQIYDLAIEMAIKADPRGAAAVNKELERRKKAHKELSEKKKKYFDPETLTNPYSDTRILAGDPKTQVKKIMAGIDMDGTEVVVADRLNQKGAGIDLVIGHHPEGNAYADLATVMDLQIGMYAIAGIPVNVADALMKERMGEIKRRIHPANHTQVVDAAKLLGIPFMALHTVWDNIGHTFINDYLKKKEFDTVGEIYDYLMELPEYIEAEKGKAGPFIVSGSESSKAGRIVTFFTGGTNPSKEIYSELAKAGVGTIIDMHMPEDAIKEMRKLHINVINAGHMSSDSIGANVFFDELEKKGVEVIACSGFIRAKRTHSTGSGQEGKK